MSTTYNKLSLSTRRSSDSHSQHSPVEQMQQATDVLAEAMRESSISQSPPSAQPTKRPASPPPPSPQSESLSKACRMEIQDQLSQVESQMVAIAIFEEKATKMQAWIDGTVEVPRELRTHRDLPGLAPGYKFSARTRAKAEEANKQQDRDYLKSLLDDITIFVIPGAFQDLQTAKETSIRKIKYQVEEVEKKAALLQFEEDFNQLFSQKNALLAQRRLKKRKHEKVEQIPQERPRKRQREYSNQRGGHRQQQSWYPRRQSDHRKH